MFNSKQKSLLPSGKVAAESKTSVFVSAGLKESAKILSGNNALKYSTTGNDFVDQFGKIGNYKVPRTFSEIDSDVGLTYGTDKLSTVVFAVYLRMISRKTMYLDGGMTEEAQRGAEMRHEGIMRMMSIYFRDKEVFWKNIGLFVSAGSWKDIFTMLSYDLVHHGWEGRKLDWERFGSLILSGLENSNTSDLVKKYLPQIKATSAQKTVESQADTLIGKWLCSKLFGTKEVEGGKTYKMYRKLKTSGTAHEWQKLISKRQFERIDFSKIHGRALSKLVQGKFLKNQGLSDKYESWITAPETKDVKYTGFVHELFENMNGLDAGRTATINKQFDTLVAKAGDTGITDLIVVRDTSGSMRSMAPGTKMSCMNVGKALALYFSEFLKGAFSNAWIEFNSDAKMHTWKGSTPVEKWQNDRSSYIGGTNFQSVIALFARLKKSGIPESDFPRGILCISDSEFNPTQLGRTNVDQARASLRSAGFSEDYVRDFVIVLWNLQSRFYGSDTGSKFETHGEVQNVFYFSGYSASVVSFLTGEEIKTASDLFEVAMDQELLNRIEI